MTIKKTFILFILPLFIINAQSIHHQQNEYYKNNKLLKLNEVHKTHLPTKTEYRNSSSIKMVFGYLPWWNYYANNYNHHPELINRIVVFSFEADSLGNLKPPPLWPWNDILNYELMMWPLDVRVIMTVTSFNGDHINGFFRNSAIKYNLIKNIKENLGLMSGVNIDFENLKDEDKDEAVINFMKELSDSIKQVKAGAEISFASPSYGYGLWDFNGLADVCDYLFVMCYDFYGNWSSTTGPSSPLLGQFFSVTKIFEEEYKNVPPEKLILGVPYYGNYWKTNSPEPYAEVKPFNPDSTNNDWQDFVTYDSAYTLATLHSKSWDNLSQTPYISWQENRWNQVWFDDSVSLSLKYDLAIQKNLKGIGIWTIGYDGKREELWNLIREKMRIVSVHQNEELPRKFVLFQNYPNPFNPTTTIVYIIHPPTFGDPSQERNKRGELVTLKVYDILGSEVTTLVNEVQPPGYYKVKFSVQNIELPSGVYFYTLKIINSSTNSVYYSAKKMILLK